MRINNSINININQFAQGFQPASGSSSPPPVEGAEPEQARPASPGKASASSPTAKAKQLALLEQFQRAMQKQGLIKEHDADSQTTDKGNAELELAPLTHLEKGSPAAFSSSTTSEGTKEIHAGTTLEDLHTQFRNGHVIPTEHSEKSDQISREEEIFYDSSDVREGDLPHSNSGNVTLENNTLTERHLSVTDDVVPQLHPEHHVVEFFQRNSQNARAAERHRRAFQNIVNSSCEKTITQTLNHACDAAASALSYSAAALSNSSLYRRSMASGTAWAMSAAFSGIDALLRQRTGARLLTDAIDFGAGVASMVTAGLTHKSNPNQKAINYAATSSNALWAAYGPLASVAAIQRGRKFASEYGATTLTYAATGLAIAGAMANSAAAVTGIASTVTSNGNNPTLNKLSSGFWMAGSVLETASMILGIVDGNREREVIHLGHTSSSANSTPYVAPITPTSSRV